MSSHQVTVGFFLSHNTDFINFHDLSETLAFMERKKKAKFRYTTNLLLFSLSWVLFHIQSAAKHRFTCYISRTLVLYLVLFVHIDTN